MLEAAYNNKQHSKVSTSTNNFSTFTSLEDEATRIQQLLQEKAEFLKVLGIAPGSKPEGITRIALQNLNGLPAKLHNNTKLEQQKSALDDLEVDIFGFNEHRNNLQHKDCRKHGISQLFNGGETMVKGIWCSNEREEIDKYVRKRSREGGTGMVAFGEMASLMDQVSSGKDETGLARWTYLEFKGKEGHSTIVLVGYCPCKNRKFDNGTSYSMQRRYFIKRDGREVCPRRMFISDLTKLLKKWKKDGKRLVVMLDANEDIYKKQIGKVLTKEDGLDMVESVMQTTGEKLSATYFRGTKPIDGIWATKDLELAGAGAMPIGFGVGDHRLLYVDVVTESMVGFQPQPIKHPKARRLNSRIPRAKRAYMKTLERQLAKHRLTEKMMEAHKKELSPEQLKAELDRIDKMSKELMVNAERRCRKLRNGKIPFSPEAAMWIKRLQFYRQLLRYWAGKVKNRGNLKRSARRCNVANAFHLTLEEIEVRMRECKDQCKHFEIYGQAYRTRHLKKRLAVARVNEDAEAERRILEIIQREKDRAYWKRINYALGKKRSSSVSAVQVVDDEGNMTEYTTQTEVQNAIWSEVHQSRYHLAEEAPICNGRLKGEFGYNATSLAAREVLEGKYEFGDDFHCATRRLMEAMAEIRQVVPVDAVDKIITREIWQKKWKKKREETASSVSTLHFGHYITGADSDEISDFHALKTSLALVHGIALERWSKGLCVMLEKVMGVRLITKLRAILLMEADFNAMNKIVYGERMLDQARKYKLMPEEIFSEKNKMADDGALSKALFYDIVRQLKRPAGLASVDAANCYDRVAHAIASLVFQAFGTPQSACTSMLTAIQEMQFFLRTAFGDSDKSVGAKVSLKTQGLMQGNGASPAGWAVVSISIIHAHKKEGHGATFLCPITNYRHDAAGILYVDDTDLIHLNLEEEESVEEAHEALQMSVDSWSDLLIASGGALKPEKCFFYLLSFGWDRKGKVFYEPNHDNPNYDVKVNLPSGDKASISHLAADEELVTLGVSSSPSGTSEGALKLVKEKALAWANASRNSNLPPRDLHFSVQRKFWPKVKYGLCANTAKYDDLVAAMHKPYHIMVSVGGVIQSAKREIRYLDDGFYGVGFPHWGIEAMVESSNKLMTHVGAKSLVGTQFQMSFEVLVLELGLSDQPFLQNYSKYKDWVTPTILTETWSRMHRFGFKMTVDTAKVKLPREGDRWFMRAVEEAGFSAQECKIINQVRLHQQVLFESDVFEADGQKLDSTYLRKRATGQSWSSYLFPRSQCLSTHLNLWKRALEQLAPGGRRSQRLGKMVEPGHKKWLWRFDEVNQQLLYDNGMELEVYERLETGGRRTRSEKYALTETIDREAFDGKICSVTESGENEVQISSRIDPAPVKSSPTLFLDALDEWGHSWMWRNLQATGATGRGLNMRVTDGFEWIKHAIEGGSLTAVSDGSYIRQLHPDLCSAAMIMECQRSKGRIVVSFPENCRQANAYRGELLGLMAIHLLLLSFNKVWPDLEGAVQIYSDCMGALDKVEHLPPHRIPSKCRHSDVLKNIMVNCSDLSFKRIFSHVSAHQEDTKRWEDLERPAQLNCGCDERAKEELWQIDLEDIPSQKQFPLEPIALFVEGNKITTESGPSIRYAAHRREAKEIFQSQKILDYDAFEEVDWRNVHTALHDVPKMFQIFACKQVFSVSATFHFLNKRDETVSPICPSCERCRETADHILRCGEEGRVKALHRFAERLAEWMVYSGVERDLVFLVVKFIRERGDMSMEDICRNFNLPPEYLTFARSQDQIGWRRMLEGMVSKELAVILNEGGVETKLDDVNKWLQKYVVNLLEITHGLWIYRNIVVHDELSGFYATEGRERLQREIEMQLEQGGEDLCEEDKWLMEVNLSDLDTSSGEKEAYWLVAVEMARARFQIRQRNVDGSSLPRGAPRREEG